MARQSRAAYLTAARDLEALATIASGENPDASAFTLPVDAATIGGTAISTSNPMPTLESSRAASANDVHAPAANTAAVVTYTADATHAHVIGSIAWSYSGVPTGGNLKVEDGSGTTVLTIDIVAAGPGFLPFPRPKRGTVNTAMIVTLAAGGAGVSGKLSIGSHWTE